MCVDVDIMVIIIMLCVVSECECVHVLSEITVGNGMTGIFILSIILLITI